jgi:chromosome segregation ATPase
LKAELEALVHRKDPEPFWTLLTPLLIDLASLLPSEKTKTSLANLESKNRELLSFQEIFFSLQKLIREHLPTNHVAKLLPLTEEMRLLQSDENPENIPKYYEECFIGISELFTEKLSPASGTHAEEKNSLVDISDTQSKNISEIEGFINELQEQNSLPLEQMGKYHNFLLGLKEQFKKNEASFNQLKQTLAESEMCTQFLESELAAAQETVKTLIENVAEDEPNDQTAESEEKIKDLEDLVGRFANESRDMLMSIQMLQDENAELRNKIDNSVA